MSGSSRDKPPAGKNKESISSDDLELWKQFTNDIEPLKDDPYLEDKREPKALPKQIRQKPQETYTERTPLNEDSISKQKPQLDRRTDEKLRKGKMPIEAILDMHGMNRIDAEEALYNFILNSKNAGKRCVLVITGKGTSRSSEQQKTTGVLKKSVPEWLQSSELRPYILKTYPARRNHGGEGALYVYLKRSRIK